MSIDIRSARSDFRIEGVKALVKAGVRDASAEALAWSLVATVTVDGETETVRESGTVSASCHTQTVAPAFPARDALLLAWFRSAALRAATTDEIAMGPDAIKSEAKRIRKEHAALAETFDAAVQAGTAPTAEERRRVDVRLD